MIYRLVYDTVNLKIDKIHSYKTMAWETRKF